MRLPYHAAIASLLVLAACGGGDSGPTQPAKTLPSCCSDKGGGTCVPSTFAGEGADKLDEEECEGLGALPLRERVL